jgi:hypothetical protein
MQSVQDAAKLNRQERTTFYVSAFLFQAWISELSLANVAQMAEQPDPRKRLFQSGQAWRAFQKFGGKAGDLELPTIFCDLMEFAQCDDSLAHHISQAMFPLSVEHELTGQFVGRRAPDARRLPREQAVALIRSTIIRLCDWLDSNLHLRVFVEWHLLPGCFDPDPKRRELTYLAINQRHFDQLDEQAKARFLNHMADAAVEQKNSPDWATFRQTASNPLPPPRPWPTERLDTAIIKLWPLVKRYTWSAANLLDVLHKVLQPADLTLCPDPVALVSHCNNVLSLRWSSNRTPHSKLDTRHSLHIALRLFHVGDDATHQTKTE